MIEYGTVKPGNAPHLMVKNLIQFSLAVVFYWFLGFGFSFRDTKSDFIGQYGFGGKGWLDDPSLHNGECFSFYSLLGIFVIYIINLSISERANYYFYVFFPSALMVFIWPVIIAWIYGAGWLNNALKNSILDYGADITVYVFAGAFAVTSSIIIGRRPGRYMMEQENSFKIHNPPIYILGCFLTILGVFGIAASQQPNSTAKVNSMHNLWISGACSSIVSLKLVTFFTQDINSHYISIYQGFISGMVVIASSAGNTAPWEAGIVGILNGAVFWFGYKLIRKVKIDDAMDVTATFLLPGIFGGLLPGFLDENVGVFWSGHKSGQTLGTQTVGVFVVLAWSVFWAIVVGVPFKIFNLIRIKDDVIIQTLAESAITQRGFESNRKMPQ
jgi:ammonium transporter, Amt family